jgi:hypothetical protein
VTRIIHPPFDGENLTRARQTIPVSRAGWCLVAAIAATTILTCTSLLIRHLTLAETAWQMASGV